MLPGVLQQIGLHPEIALRARIENRLQFAFERRALGEDSKGMDAVLPADVRMDRVIADGAYYSIESTEALSGAGVTPDIRPPAHAVVHSEERTRRHDQIVRYIEDIGIYAFNTATVCARWSRHRSRASSAASVNAC
ncbi:hypothetical protein OKW33_006506 [Paraburkholderia atlantica]|uniref:Uncharacterized protein n=1 Tax=Paraburkholderia atlantica TaxID=2654982 RepID=A0A7W8QGK4_PARAM|nr:hypothetical protein [Paraburkholderia atlantica]